MGTFTKLFFSRLEIVFKFSTFIYFLNLLKIWKRNNLIILLLFFTLAANSATYYLKDGQRADLTSSWTTNVDETGSNPSNFTSKNDVFIVPDGKSGNVSANWAIGYATSNLLQIGNWELRVLGTLTINDGIEVLIRSGNASNSNFNVNSNGKLIIKSTGHISFTGGNALFSPRLNINSGATFVVANPAGIDGAVGTGTLLSKVFSSSANYEFNGADQLIAGLPALGVGNLTLSNSGSKTLGQNLTVNGTLLVQDNVSLDIVPNMTIRANNVVNDAGRYGIVIHSSESAPAGSLIFANGSPTATVLFYSKAFKGTDYKYQFFGIPFTSMLPIVNLDGSWLYKYNESNTEMWEPVARYMPMEPIQGYAITQDAPKTYEMYGTLYNASFSQPLSYTIANIDTDDYKKGENILANPYTCAIPINRLNFINAEETVYLYNTGSYSDWQGQSGTGENPGQYLSVPKLLPILSGLPTSIPSMQGFLVKATSEGSSLSFNYATDILSTYGNAAPLRVKSDEILDTIYSIIDIKGEHFGDKMWLVTLPNSTKKYDNGFDGRKMLGSALTPQLFAIEDDGNFQVNSVPDINNMILGFVPGIDTEYTMTFTHNNTNSIYPNGIYLVDLHKGITINVSESGSTYTFSTEQMNVNQRKVSSELLDNARFKILTSPNTTTSAENNNLESLKIFTDDNKIIIDNKGNAQGNIKIYDATGRILSVEKFDSGLNTINTMLTKGIYLIEANNQVETIKSRIIIK